MLSDVELTRLINAVECDLVEFTVGARVEADLNIATYILDSWDSSESSVKGV